MSLEVMQILMYLVVSAAIIMYVVLDGFDLGVGAMQIFAGSDMNRRVFLNSIGPFWDGNEVWLIIIAGGLFVGFPDVYAAVFSGFYILFMIFLCGIIFRAVAIEFRSKHDSMVWRYTWDTVFWLSSLIIIFDSGIILGNLIQGVPVNADREVFFPFTQLFSPFSILISLLSISLFTLHGNHFLLMKTEGQLAERLHSWAPWTTALFCTLLSIVTYWAWSMHSYMIVRFIQYPLFMLLPLALVVTIIAMVLVTRKRLYGFSFFCSMLTIVILFSLFAVGYFPNILISTISPKLSLNLYNASASETTLAVALSIALIGLPLVFAYGFLIYRIFRGKTRLHDHSY